MTKIVMNRKEPDFDIFYDFRKDSGGKDPDMASPTLRRYHRLLWSKPLPNGEIMQLTHDNGGYLIRINHLVILKVIMSIIPLNTVIPISK